MPLDMESDPLVGCFLARIAGHSNMTGLSRVSHNSMSSPLVWHVTHGGCHVAMGYSSQRSISLSQSPSVSPSLHVWPPYPFTHMLLAMLVSFTHEKNNSSMMSLSRISSLQPNLKAESNKSLKKLNQELQSKLEEGMQGDLSIL